MNSVLDEELRRDELEQMFAQWDRERGPPSAEDEAWAARVFGQ